MRKNKREHKRSTKHINKSKPAKRRDVAVVVARREQEENKISLQSIAHEIHELYEHFILKQFREETTMGNLPSHLKEQVHNASDSGGGVYINHGDYILLFKKCFFQKGHESENVINELFVIEALKKRVFEDGKAVEQEPNQVGTDVSYVIDFLGKGKQSAGKNLRGIAIGLFNLTPGDKSGIIDLTVDDMVAPESPVEFMLIGLSTYAQPVRSRPGEFITGMKWKCVAKPGTDGLNSKAFVSARKAAFTSGGDQALLAITIKQLEEARKVGGAPALSQIGAEEEKKDAAAPVAAPTPAPPAGASTPPPIQSAAPPLPSIPVVDPFAGWIVHPEDKTGNTYYRGDVVKSKSELLAAAGR